MSEDQQVETFTDEQIAQVAHNVVASIRRAQGDVEVGFWHQLPEDAWQKQDTLRQVEFVRENPDLSARDEHSAWVNKRIKEGWAYGSRRDESTKKNPLLVPWHELSFIHRARSKASFEVIRILLGLA